MDNKKENNASIEGNKNLTFSFKQITFYIILHCLKFIFEYLHGT